MRLTMSPAYSSVSTKVSWSQMKSSCCLGTEKSGFWKELNVVWEERVAFRSMTSLAHNVKIKTCRNGVCLGQSFTLVWTVNLTLSLSQRASGMSIIRAVSLLRSTDTDRV